MAKSGLRGACCDRQGVTFCLTACFLLVLPSVCHKGRINSFPHALATDEEHGAWVKLSRSDTQRMHYILFKTNYCGVVCTEWSVRRRRPPRGVRGEKETE
eukprot:1148073-Pelagomonas_calceolata.AAC.5